jgi:hypothetical protein
VVRWHSVSSSRQMAFVDNSFFRRVRKSRAGPLLVRIVFPSRSVQVVSRLYVESALFLDDLPDMHPSV